VIAIAECDDGLYLVEIETDELVGHESGGAVDRPRPADLAPAWVSATLVDVDARDAVIVLAVDARPPLLVSADAGATWTERGAGLPVGRAVAIGPTPDDLLYAARNRLYVSENGGVFWRALAIELPEIRDVAWG
jgi:hypothetical protein